MSVPATTATIDQAKTEFLKWWDADNRLGQGDYFEVAKKVKKVAKGLPVEEMTLHRQMFRFGFDIYYGEKEGEKQYIPISWEDGVLLERQTNKSKKPWWPMKDPESGNYYLLNVTVDKIPPPTGSTPTDQYLQDLVNRVNKYFIEEAMKILTALKPYASMIKNNCGDHGILYLQIKEIVPDFPDV